MIDMTRLPVLDRSGELFTESVDVSRYLEDDSFLSTYGGKREEIVREAIHVGYKALDDLAKGQRRYAVADTLQAKDGTPLHGQYSWDEEDTRTHYEWNGTSKPKITLSREAHEDEGKQTATYSHEVVAHGTLLKYNIDHDESDVHALNRVTLHALRTAPNKGVRRKAHIGYNTEMQENALRNYVAEAGVRYSAAHGNGGGASSGLTKQGIDLVFDTGKEIAKPASTFFKNYLGFDVPGGMFDFGKKSTHYAVDIFDAMMKYVKEQQTSSSGGHGGGHDTHKDTHAAPAAKKEAAHA